MCVTGFQIKISYKLVLILRINTSMGSFKRENSFFFILVTHVKKTHYSMKVRKRKGTGSGR